MYKLSTSGALSGDQPKQRRISSMDGAVSGGHASKPASAKRAIGTSTAGTVPSSATSNGIAATHLTNGSGVSSVGDEAVASFHNGHQRLGGGDKPTGKKNVATVHHRKHLYGSRLPMTAMTHANGTGNGCADSDSTTSSLDAIAMVTGHKNGEADENNNSINVRSGQSRRRRSNIDELLKVYFPVTLKGDATDSIRRRPNDVIIVDSTAKRSSAHRSRNQNCNGSGPRRMRSAGSRQSSTRSSSSSTSNGSFDRIYLAAMDDARLGKSHSFIS